MLLGGQLESLDNTFFCGFAGGLKFCYTFCPSPGGGVVEKRSTDLACLIYDNGNPANPALTNDQVDALFLPFIASATSPTDLFCGDVATIMYCLENCNVYMPVINPGPAPCFFELKGTEVEILISRLAFSLDYLLGGQQQDERFFCPYSSLNSDLTVCRSNFYRLCRPDNNGVIGLPDGETKCLIYLNGPAAGVGVLAATALGGIATTTASFFGTGFGLVVGTSGAVALGMCPAPLYCRVGPRCCLLVMTPNGLKCPSGC